MNEGTFLHLVQILAAAVLVISVLFQGGGVGLSSPLVGGESYKTRRGFERVLFFTTIAAAVVFIFAVFANLLVR